MKHSNRPIHVVHIIPTLNFGGAEKFVIELTNHIPQKNIKQSIITLWDSRPLLSQVRDGVVCEVVPFPQTPRMRRISTIANKLTDMQADVVHTHLFSADVWGRLAARRAGVPVITTEHNINRGESMLWGFIKRRLRNLSAVYTAPSHAVEQYMQKTYHIAQKNIRVIQHGIELEKFIHTKKATLKSPFKLALVGRITKQKGHKIALDALKELKDIDCELHITGDGELKDELVTYAQTIGVDSHVVWHTSVQDVSSVYATCDIVLVPSLWEGLGLVVLEAQASGRIVIACAVDGIVEIITDGETGFLVSAHDSNALAEKIRYSFSHVDEVKHIAHKAREWAKEHADVAVMARAYEKLYKQITSKE